MAGNKKPLRFGSTNPVHGPLIGSEFDPREDTLFGSLGTMWNKLYTPDVFAGITRWTGYIVREEAINEKSIGSGKRTNNTNRPAVTGNMKVRSFKVWIPELHAWLPKIKSLEDHAIISMIPGKTEAIKDIANEPLAVGTKVWVSFHNQASWSDPYIQEVISSDATELMAMVSPKIFLAAGAGSAGTTAGYLLNENPWIKPVDGPLRATPPTDAEGFRKIKHFYQNRGPFRNVKFHGPDCTKAQMTTKGRLGGTIRAAGCGPTSLAICMASYGLSVDPKIVGDALVQYTVRTGKLGRTCNGGSNPFVKSIVDDLSKGSLKAKWITYNQLIKELQSTAKDGKRGKCVVAHACSRGSYTKKKASRYTSYKIRKAPWTQPGGSQGKFTRGGHYIALTGYKDGKIRVNNPSYTSSWQGDRWNTRPLGQK